MTRRLFEMMNVGTCDLCGIQMNGRNETINNFLLNKLIDNALLINK